ncbi:hypothetical protein BOX15_Mlig028623g2 [Macrostomum lignano]|uniref:C-type lectin domain-containing protein n=2 Tax=Macrostomum lignano TaxID=282301 RepID=A0A1I8GJJ7_9PLAT|nr:hypothetical protein BOX15_Mlig028623g2 [Macrostomum lignano]
MLLVKSHDYASLMANWKAFQVSFILSAVTVCTFCDRPAQAQVQSYRCRERTGPQTIVASGTIQLELKHPIYTYLHPNQNCEMRVQYRSSSVGSARSHRWLVSVVNASMRAYSASAKFFNSIDPNPPQSASVEPSLTLHTPQLDSYQFVTDGNNFSVVFATMKLPEAHSTGLVLRAEPFDRCPNGWFDTGISCYGLPFLPDVAQVNKAQGDVACARLGGGSLSQGVYTSDHIAESIENLLSIKGNESKLNLTYWVGIVRAGEGSTITAGSKSSTHNFSYSNGYKTPHKVELIENCQMRLASPTASSCNCVIYRSAGVRFLAENCNSTHRYICTMPLPALHRRDSTDYECNPDSCPQSGGVSVAWRSAAVTLIVLILLVMLAVPCLPKIRQLYKSSAPI